MLRKIMARHSVAEGYCVNVFRSFAGILVVLSLPLLVGCGESSQAYKNPPAQSTGLAPGGAKSIYVATTPWYYGDPGVPNYSIQEYPAGANGATNPTSTVALPSAFGVDDFGMDSSGGLYVVAGSFSVPGIESLYYPPEAGSSTRTLALQTASGNDAIAVDSSGQLYDVATDGSDTISVYAAGASGTDAPIRTFTTTALDGVTVQHATIDAAGHLYIAVLGDITKPPPYNGAVLEFQANATGAVLPIRGIYFPYTTFVYALAVDNSGNVYVSIGNGLDTSVIEEFSPSSPTYPIRTVDLTGTLSAVNNLCLDSAGNLYVLGFTQGPSPKFVIDAIGPNVSGASAATTTMPLNVGDINVHASIIAR